MFTCFLEGDEVDEATEESGSEEVGEIDADSDADDGDEASKPDGKQRFTFFNFVAIFSLLLITKCDSYI